MINCIGYFATEACAGTRRDRRAAHAASPVCIKITETTTLALGRVFSQAALDRNPGAVTYTELDAAAVATCEADYTDFEGALAAGGGRRERRAAHGLLHVCIGYFATQACAGTRRSRRAGHASSAVCNQITGSPTSEDEAIEPRATLTSTRAAPWPHLSPSPIFF